MIKSFILIFTLIIFEYLIRELYNIDFIPYLNNIVRNYLYLIGIFFSILLYFFFLPFLKKSISLKIIIIIGLVICNIMFYFKVTLFNSKYNEITKIVINKSSGLYVSEVSSSSSLLFGLQKYYRIYKKEFPFGNSIKLIYASDVCLIPTDSSVYKLQYFKSGVVDTIYLPK